MIGDAAAPIGETPLLVSIVGATGMNTRIENNMLYLLCQTISVRPVPCLSIFPLTSISSICWCRSTAIMT